MVLPEIEVDVIEEEEEEEEASSEIMGAKTSLINDLSRPGTLHSSMQNSKLSLSNWMKMVTKSFAHWTEEKSTIFKDKCPSLIPR